MPTGKVAALASMLDKFYIENPRPKHKDRMSSCDDQDDEVGLQSSQYQKYGDSVCGDFTRLFNSLEKGSDLLV